MHNSENNNSTTRPVSRKKKYNKKVLLIIFALLIILATTAYLFKEILMLEYYNLRNNHAHKNDKLYTADWMGKKDGKYVLNLYRTAEPVNGNGKKIAVEGGWVINSDSLAKNHSDFVGYYQGYQILDTEFGTKMLYYKFGTNKLGLERRNYESEIELPKGYKFTNEPFYVLGFEISTNAPVKSGL